MPPRALPHELEPTFASKQLCSLFCDITGADTVLAQRFLCLAKGGLDQAVNLYLDSPRSKWQSQSLPNSGGQSAQPEKQGIERNHDGNSFVERAHKRKRSSPSDASKRTTFHSQSHEAESEAVFVGGSEPATIDLTGNSDEEGGELLASCRMQPSCAVHESNKQLVDTPLQCGCLSIAANAPSACGWYHSLPSHVEPVVATAQERAKWLQVLAEQGKGLANNQGDGWFVDGDFPPCAASIDGGRETKPPADGGADGGGSAWSRLVCKCGVLAKLSRVSKDGPNMGRRFLGCPVRACNFFLWADRMPSSSSARALTWRRFLPPRFRLVSTRRGFGPDHVRQGGVGDCWFLSALSVVAERHDLVDTVVCRLPHTASEEPAKQARLTVSNGVLEGAGEAAGGARERGAFLLRLFLDGQWRGVIVDSMLPCKPPVRSARASVQGDATNVPKVGSVRAGEDVFELAFSRAAKGQIWVPVVEKAYAKWHGSYDAISGGHVAEGLMDLTGCPTESVELGDGGWREGIDYEEVWRRLLSFAAARFPMGCATALDGSLREVGLVGCHAYSILEVRELVGARPGVQKKLRDCLGSTSSSSHAEEANTRGGGAGPSTLRLLRIRNPWGRKEFKGEWGAKSERWTRVLSEELGRTQREDGTFWMSFDDFITSFCVVDVCKSYPAWHALTIPTSLPATSHGARGSAAAFEVQVGSDTCWTWAMLLQPTKRAGGSKLDPSYWLTDLSLLVLRRCGPGGADTEVVSSMLCGRRRSSYLELMLEGGSVYVFVVVSFTSRHSAPMSLRLYSARPLCARQCALPDMGHALTCLPVLVACGGGDTSQRTRVIQVVNSALLLCLVEGDGALLVYALNSSQTAQVRLQLEVRCQNMTILEGASGEEGFCVGANSVRLLHALVDDSPSTSGKYGMRYMLGGSGAQFVVSAEELWPDVDQDLRAEGELMLSLVRERLQPWSNQEEEGDVQILPDPGLTATSIPQHGTASSSQQQRKRPSWRRAVAGRCEMLGAAIGEASGAVQLLQRGQVQSGCGYVRGRVAAREGIGRGV